MADQEQNAPEKQIAIQKIYVKDFSFESPHTPDVFAKQDWSPKTNLNLRSSHTSASESSHEVVLTITIEAKDDDQTYFLLNCSRRDSSISPAMTKKSLKRSSEATARTYCSRTHANPWLLLLPRVVFRSSFCNRLISMRCISKEWRKPRRRLLSKRRSPRRLPVAVTAEVTEGRPNHRDRNACAGSAGCSFRRWLMGHGAGIAVRARRPGGSPVGSRCQPARCN